MTRVGAAYDSIDNLSAASAGAGADFMPASQSGTENKMTLTQLATFMETAMTNVTLNAGSIITDTTTGLKIGTTSAQKVGFYGTTPVVQPVAVTAADAVALDATYNVTEQTTMSNMRVRINEMATALTNVGIFQ